MNQSPFRKILVAVDGSECSMEAARKAAEVARVCAASIVLVHVRDRVPEFIGAPYYQHLLDAIVARTEALLEPYQEILRAGGVAYEERVLEGNAARSICTAAEAEPCDLIVMGSHGFTDFEGLFMGSVSHRVIAAAPCPVMVVR